MTIRELAAAMPIIRGHEIAIKDAHWNRVYSGDYSCVPRELEHMEVLTIGWNICSNGPISLIVPYVDAQLHHSLDIIA